MQPLPASTQEQPEGASPGWAAYVAPMAAFVLLTQLEPRSGAAYPWLYTAKIALVAGLMTVFRRAWRDARPRPGALLPGILVGLAVFAEWVLIERFVPYPRLGARTGFNPFQAIQDPLQRGAFLAARFWGLVLLVPLMEELFWRSFLLRWLSRPQFNGVPIGEFTWGAFWLVAAGFALAHPEWLPALICAVAYGLLLRRTRSLYACVVAHSVTNLALGAHVVATGAWHLW